MRRKQERPTELLSAALDLFVERGFAATRVEEVAHRAGVSKGTLFLYFATKEDLFKAVVRANVSSLYPEWSEELDQFEGSASELLHHAMRAWWLRFGGTKASGISKLIVSEASNFPELASFYQQEVIEPGHALIGRILQRGIDRGEFRRFDLRHGIYAVLAQMLFLVMWRHSLGACAGANPPLVPEEYLRIQIDTILHGLLADAPAAPSDSEKGS